MHRKSVKTAQPEHSTPKSPPPSAGPLGNFPSNISDTDTLKATIMCLISTPDFSALRKEVRDWYWDLDSQGPFSKHRLLHHPKPPSAQSSGTKPPVRLEDFKCFSFLLDKYGLSAKEVSELSRVSFDQYLKTKSIPDDQGDEAHDGEKLDDLLEDADTFSLDLPLFDDTDTTLTKTRIVEEKPRHKRLRQQQQQQGKDGGRPATSFLGKKSTRPVLEDISDDESEEEGEGKSKGGQSGGGGGGRDRKVGEESEGEEGEGEEQSRLLKRTHPPLHH